MKLISHRGNLHGPDPRENEPSFILEALSKGFDVEIDLRLVSGCCYLGHDYPQYEIQLEFLKIQGLWIHCKNIEALELCRDLNIVNDYFWHQDDDVTLTSNNFLWTFPGKELTRHSIAVMPEMVSFSNLKVAYGICSDFIETYI